MEALGGGLASLAFWGFLAAVVVGGIWYAVREKEAQHETVRRIVESGRPIDEKVVESIFRDNDKTPQDLRVGGIITLSVAPGLAMLGWFLSFISDAALMPLLGVAVLVGSVGAGLLLAARVADRSRRKDDTGPLI
jgi:hypothetical protein